MLTPKTINKLEFLQKRSREVQEHQEYVKTLPVELQEHYIIVDAEDEIICDACNNLIDPLIEEDSAIIFDEIPTWLFCGQCADERLKENQAS